MLKRCALLTLLVFAINMLQPAPAYAGFFLFNIINSIFGGNQDAKLPAKKQESTTALRYGMKSSQVEKIQQKLINAEYLAGQADGKFGPKTLQAVREFQRDRGLEPDGIVGVRTLDALQNFRGKKQKKQETPLPRLSPAAKPTPSQFTHGIPAYSYSIPMVVTAYTRYDEGCTDYTFRGTYLRRGLVAVDPKVIPLGTHLYIPGYGEGLADDIGGAIQGNRVDLAMETLDEAFEWGVQRLTVYVLP